MEVATTTTAEMVVMEVEYSTAIIQVLPYNIVKSVKTLQENMEGLGWEMERWEMVVMEVE